MVNSIPIFWLFLQKTLILMTKIQRSSRFLLIAVLLMAFNGCSNQPSVPRGFPKEKQMADILADIYLAEATMNAYPMGYRENMDSKSVSYYKDVLEKHNLTKQQFDTIFAWYTSNPYLFTKVYDRVISILGTKEAELKNILLREDSLNRIALEKEKIRLEESNLWKGASVINLPIADTSNISIDFSAPLDSLSGVSLKLEARYRFLKENQINRAWMMMMVCYSDSTCDTTRYELDRSFALKQNTLSFELPDSLIAVSVKGTLLEYDTLKKVSAEIRDIRLSIEPKVEEAQSENKSLKNIQLYE